MNKYCLTLSALLLSAAVISPSARAIDPLADPAAAAATKPAEKITQPKDINDAFTLLGSSSYGEREEALTFLLRQPADALSLVEKRLEVETDSECIPRLARIALHLYMKEVTSLEGKSSMLGIALNLDTVTLPAPIGTVAAVTVTDLQPGFPAAENLKTGDRIIGINGKYLPADYSIEEFRLFINTQKPGVKIQFSLLRGKNQIKVAVPLAGLPEAGVESMNLYMERRRERIAAYAANLNRRLGQNLNIPSEISADHIMPGAPSPDLDPR